MKEVDMYLQQIIGKYTAQNLANYSYDINQLKVNLKSWAAEYYVGILESGSRAKNTAISLASDVDFLISLKSGCNENTGGLKGIYNSLYERLNSQYKNVRKQNVSFRIYLNGLSVDVTPARQQKGSINDHSLYMSKQDSWKQTNIQKHTLHVLYSGRINEIKLLKIWRELHRLDFPSIYLEYLLILLILRHKPSNIDNLSDNFWHILQELSNDSQNPLYARIEDPANSNNVLSDLLNQQEKRKIIEAAKKSTSQKNWNAIVW